MDLTLAEIAGDEALREIGLISGVSSALTYGTYQAAKAMTRVRNRGMFSPSGSRRRNVRRRLTYSPTYGPMRAPSTLSPTASLAPSTTSATVRTRFYHNLGTRPGSFGTKRSTFNTGKTTGLFDKEIHSIPLVRIPFSDADDVLNSREHRIVNVRGVKFRKWFQFKPEKTNIDRPITIRWAVINPKDNSGDRTVDINPGTNWFVSEDPENEFMTDFPSTGNSFDYMSRAINRKKYGVLKQGHFTLSPDPGQTSNYKDNRYQKLLQFYIPIKRQMKWPNNTTANLPNANIYFAWWYCDTGDMETAQQYATTNNVPIQTMNRITTYFRTAKPFM